MWISILILKIIVLCSKLYHLLTLVAAFEFALIHYNILPPQYKLATLYPLPFNLYFSGALALKFLFQDFVYYTQFSLSDILNAKITINWTASLLVGKEQVLDRNLESTNQRLHDRNSPALWGPYTFIWGMELCLLRGLFWGLM